MIRKRKKNILWPKRRLCLLGLFSPSHGVPSSCADVSRIAAVPVVIGARRAPAAIVPPGPGSLISFVVIIFAFLVFSSSLPWVFAMLFLSPPGVRPGPGLPRLLFPPRVRRLKLSLLSRCVIVISCRSRRCVWSLWFPVVADGPRCAHCHHSPFSAVGSRDRRRGRRRR